MEGQFKRLKTEERKVYVAEKISAFTDANRGRIEEKKK